MKNFIVYTTEGKILRTGSCPDDMVNLQKGQGELVMEGKANDINHVIVDGKVVEYVKTPEDIAKEEQKKAEQQKNLLIQNKMQEILRKQAIDALAKEGKL